MRILITGQHRGSTNALAPIAQELIKRGGHELTLYATGNQTEAAGFSGLEYEHLQGEIDYRDRVRGYDLVVVGLSGYKTADGEFLKAANKAQIPTLAVLDQPMNYKDRFGYLPEHIPTKVAVISPRCLDSIRSEMFDLGSELVLKLIAACKVVGFTSYDSLGQMRAQHTSAKRDELLKKLSIDPEQLLRLHFTSNVAPGTRYNLSFGRVGTAAAEFYGYEIATTGTVMQAARDMGLTLVIKPHPAEEGEVTQVLAKHFGHLYVPAKACDSKELMLAAAQVTGGRTGAINEACLFDVNTGGLFPEMDEARMKQEYPAVGLGAIPTTYTHAGIEQLLKDLSDPDPSVEQRLKEARTRFSTDAKASQRAADIIESMR